MPRKPESLAFEKFQNTLCHTKEQVMHYCTAVYRMRPLSIFSSFDFPWHLSAREKFDVNQQSVKKIQPLGLRPDVSMYIYVWPSLMARV